MKVQLAVYKPTACSVMGLPDAIIKKYNSFEIVTQVPFINCVKLSMIYNDVYKCAYYQVKVE